MIIPTEGRIVLIGRTGRAGHDGIALSFCESEELPYLKDIQKLIGKSIPVIKEQTEIWRGVLL